MVVLTLSHGVVHLEAAVLAASQAADAGQVCASEVVSSLMPDLISQVATLVAHTYRLAGVTSVSCLLTGVVG